MEVTLGARVAWLWVMKKQSRIKPKTPMALQKKLMREIADAHLGDVQGGVKNVTGGCAFCGSHDPP